MQLYNSYPFLKVNCRVHVHVNEVKEETSEKKRRNQKKLRRQRKLFMNVKRHLFITECQSVGDILVHKQRASRVIYCFSF